MAAVSAALTCIVLLPWRANADDVKVYSGARCLAVNEKHDYTVDRQYGRLENITTEDTYVVCPIPKDRRSTNGSDRIAIRVDRNGSSDNVACSFRSHNVHGTELDYRVVEVGNAGSNVNGNGTEWEAVSPATTSSESGGFYSMLCELPPGTELISYRIDEYSGDDDCE